MRKQPITLPEGAPAHICSDLVREVNAEIASEDRYVEELVRKVDSGEITEGDADRRLADFPESARTDMMEYCAGHCGPGTCALKGFGVELVGADYDELSPEDKAKFRFFQTVDTNRYVTEVTLGVAL